MSESHAHLLNGCHHDVLDGFLKCHYLLDLLCVWEKTTESRDGAADCGLTQILSEEQNQPE